MPKKNKFIIAIDGPAASGKGTVARQIANILGFVYLDTGKIYRALAQKVIDNHINSQDTETVLELVPQLSLEALDDVRLKQEDVGNMASKIAANADIRQALVAFQHNIAYNPVFADGTYAQGSVLDGRDIGSVICPDADIKFYITASLEARAQRRYLELKEKDKSLTYEGVYQDLHSRDERDQNRNCAPLQCSQESIKIDTTDMSSQEVYDKAMDYIQQTNLYNEVAAANEAMASQQAVKCVNDHKGR